MTALSCQRQGEGLNSRKREFNIGINLPCVQGIWVMKPVAGGHGRSCLDGAFKEPVSSEHLGNHFRYSTLRFLAEMERNRFNPEVLPYSAASSGQINPVTQTLKAANEVLHCSLG